MLFCTAINTASFARTTVGGVGFLIVAAKLKCPKADRIAWPEIAIHKFALFYPLYGKNKWTVLSNRPFIYFA
jgi:hypothetical protein